jgi:hypothetical protein
VTVLIGFAFIAVAVVLLAGLAVTHRPDPDDPWEQPHREVEPWPTS